jgi:8-oxo-dGTP pyrophosphatase MutT (NUDIX family)
MSQQFFSDEFVTSAGGVLFRMKPGHPLEICHQRKEEWLLPKGRKDLGESVEKTALREVYEETGWKAVPFPATMCTRATVPDVEGSKVKQPDQPHLVTALSTEPFAITIRGNTDNRNMKIIYWFIFTVADPECQQTRGTQMEGEDFDKAIFLEASHAIDTLSFHGDRELARRALGIVRNTMRAGLDGAVGGRDY